VRETKKERSYGYRRKYLCCVLENKREPHCNHVNMSTVRWPPGPKRQHSPRPSQGIENPEEPDPGHVAREQCGFRGCASDIAINQAKSEIRRNQRHSVSPGAGRWVISSGHPKREVGDRQELQSGVTINQSHSAPSSFKCHRRRVGCLHEAREHKMGVHPH
jgi:hypothetical protein